MYFSIIKIKWKKQFLLIFMERCEWTIFGRILNFFSSHHLTTLYYISRGTTTTHTISAAHHIRRHKSVAATTLIQQTARWNLISPRILSLTHKNPEFQLSALTDEFWENKVCSKRDEWCLYSLLNEWMEKYNKETKLQRISQMKK